jgi:N4-gp56 family major capsid protein
MARTIVGLNSPLAVQKYSSALFVDVNRTAYWQKKFTSDSPDAPLPVQRLTQLENDAGDKINFDLSLQLKMEPVEGDDTLEGQEEDLKFYSDDILIDQMRGGVNTGGRMTRKRTLHDLRTVARTRQGEWWVRVFDELHFMYASGARGVNSDFIFRTSYSGFAGNSLVAPDSEHLMYGGDATSKATVDSADKMTLSVIDKAKTKATMMGGGTEGTPQIQPIMVDGEEAYCLLMNPWQEYDLRTATTTGGWLDIQKSLATSLGKNSPIIKGALGMHNNVVLHSHKSVIRFSDYGSGSNVKAARSLFIGRQALACAFGSSGGGLRFDWNEESRDNGNQAVITTGAIFGVKKVRFNSKDFGLIAIDTAAADPNA